MRPLHRWTATAAALAATALAGCTPIPGLTGDDASSAPPNRAPVEVEGVEHYYGEYEDYAGVLAAVQGGNVTVDELDHPWVFQQGHVDAVAGWDGTPPEYELRPPAGGDHLGQWQTCTGTVYDAPILDGNAVHSLEHGAVWLTYDPELVDQAAVDALGLLIRGRDYTLMSPYPGLGVAVSLQSWGVRYQTEDPADPQIGAYLDFYVLNERFNPELNATCAGGVSTTAEL